MGVDMPSCPGQQAMQQQVEALQGKQAELMKQAQAQDAHIKVLNAEIGQSKALLAQVSQTVLAQKEALDRLEATVRSLTETLNQMNSKGAKGKAASSAKSAPAGKPAAMPAKKKGH